MAAKRACRPKLSTSPRAGARSTPLAISSSGRSSAPRTSSPSALLRVCPRGTGITWSAAAYRARSRPALRSSPATCVATHGRAAMRRNVLITAASRRVPLVDAFQRVLRETGGRVIVTDVNAMSPAVHVADAAFRVPLATDAGYVEALEGLCEAHDIGLLVPTIDDELEIIGASRDKFEAAGVHVAASSTETAAICNDKLRTSEVLRARGVPAAE